jgi:hypothetical protein
MLPYVKEYMEVPILHHTENAPQNGKYFSKKIGCADDIAYYASIEQYNLENAVEYRALGFSNRLKQAMMSAARNPLCEKASFIIFTCNALEIEYKNPVIGVLENEHENRDKNLIIEYE